MIIVLVNIMICLLLVYIAYFLQRRIDNWVMHSRAMDKIIIDIYERLSDLEAAERNLRTDGRIGETRQPESDAYPTN